MSASAGVNADRAQACTAACGVGRNVTERVLCAFWSRPDVFG